MTKKKKEVIKEVENKEGNTNLQDEEVKTSPTTEELLAIEQDSKVKEQKIRGFSIEGYFADRLSNRPLDKQVDQ